MKKIFQIFVIIACSVGVLTSCHTKNSKAEIKFMFDDEGNYTGFSNLPTDDKVEDYEKKGYYVTQDSEVIANQEVWERFIETATGDNNTSIRIVSLYTDEKTKGPYYQDLFYIDGNYYLFDSSSENLKKEPFEYLLVLEGQFGNPIKDSGVVILTDDNTLTFEDIMNYFISSVIPDIPPFKLIMFQ